MVIVFVEDPSLICEFDASLHVSSCKGTYGIKMLPRICSHASEQAHHWFSQYLTVLSMRRGLTDLSCSWRDQARAMSYTQAIFRAAMQVVSPEDRQPAAQKNPESGSGEQHSPKKQPSLEKGGGGGWVASLQN